MHKNLTAAIFIALVSGHASAQESGSPVPEWYRDYVGHMTAGDGLWVAQNPGGEDELTHDAYGIQWRAMPGNSGMTGRLFGFEDGQQTEDWWEFREFWHAGERRIAVMQWGFGGAHGTGWLTQIGEGRFTLEQDLYLPGGQHVEGGHVIRLIDGPAYVAEQYRIAPDEGRWVFEHALTFEYVR